MRGSSPESGRHFIADCVECFVLCEIFYVLLLSKQYFSQLKATHFFILIEQDIEHKGFNEESSQRNSKPQCFAFHHSLLSLFTRQIIYSRDSYHVAAIGNVVYMCLKTYLLYKTRYTKCEQLLLTL